MPCVVYQRESAKGYAGRCCNSAFLFFDDQSHFVCRAPASFGDPTDHKLTWKKAEFQPRVTDASRPGFPCALLYPRQLCGGGLSLKCKQPLQYGNDV